MNDKQITLQNDIEKRNFFYAIKKSKRLKKVKIEMKSPDTISVIIPNTFSGKIWEKINTPESFLEKNKHWIFTASKKLQKNNISKIPLTDNNWKEKKEQFLKIAKERIQYFNHYYGFTYNNIYIKDTKTRWGSCSSAGNLNFNYRVFMLEPEHRDYIIVHEMCHLAEMNHSKKFWNLVEKKSPNYKVVRESLKKYHFEIN